MTLALTQTRLLTVRSLRTLGRQPVFLAFNLIQPLLWLLLFGTVFSAIDRLPGIGDSYLEYLAPGVVAMTAMLTANWAGSDLIQDIERGVMDRTLSSPTRRGAIIAASIVYQGICMVILGLIVFAAAWLAGVRYPGSWVGVPVTIGLAVLLAAAFTALSDALAVLLRSQNALIGLSQFLTLPLSFLSSVMIAPSLMPSWVASAAKWNPLDWAATGSREALSASPDWALVGRDAAQLAALALVLAVAAVSAFRTYQRSS
ncbi:ABC transporter permease [Cryptosporangium aurantiacum]|uniref:Transport permease protein n=1 Tax=Cryptosporangium aurantiacum TaxID=134849 RepID=A0A1M7HNU3_9ACTN|nr:ABC transporter permease [Cryptosporangium aurantiacum]SHM29787.1 ABC-2 type transport system permease protein [Cryptosporangium aurantiacum]